MFLNSQVLKLNFSTCRIEVSSQNGRMKKPFTNRVRGGIYAQAWSAIEWLLVCDEKSELFQNLGENFSELWHGKPQLSRE